MFTSKLGQLLSQSLILCPTLSKFTLYRRIAMAFA